MDGLIRSSILYRHTTRTPIFFRYKPLCSNIAYSMDYILRDSAGAIVHESVNQVAQNWTLRESFCSVFAFSTILILYTITGIRINLACTLVAMSYANRSVLAIYLSSAAQYTTLIHGLFVVTLIACLYVAALASRSSYTSTWQGPGKPYLIPCRTTHQRFFPKRHSFSYSYLSIGIPVGFEGSVNGMIGVKESYIISWSNYLVGKRIPRSWYTVRASDHLQRDQDKLVGLRGKLDDYLQSEVRLQDRSMCSLLMRLGN